MIAMGELLTRMQQEATGCLAVFTVRLHDAEIVEWCGEGNRDAAAAGVVAELFARDGVVLPSPTDELIVLGDNHTYVCQRVHASPDLAVAAICEAQRNLGLATSLLRRENA